MFHQDLGLKKKFDSIHPMLFRTYFQQKVNNINVTSSTIQFLFKISFYTVNHYSSNFMFLWKLFTFYHVMSFLPDVLCKALRIFRNETIILDSFYAFHSQREWTFLYCKQYFLLGNVPAPIQSSYLKRDLKITVGKMMKDFRSPLFDRVFPERERERER